MQRTKFTSSTAQVCHRPVAGLFRHIIMTLLLELLLLHPYCTHAPTPAPGPSPTLSSHPCPHPFPLGLQALSELVHLEVADNTFTGALPLPGQDNRVLSVMDASRNQLSGEGAAGRAEKGRQVGCSRKGEEEDGQGQ